MSKKKAIKITTATAIAASAFVAVAPTQSEAATSSVDKAITKATNQMAKAYDTYHKTAKNEGKLPATGTIRNQVALAKDYYAAAEKEIAKNGGSKTKKAAYTKTLNAKKYFLDRAEAYLAAINTNLNPAKTAFTAAVETGKAKNVVSAKAALKKDVDAFKAIVAKIYGPDVRDLLEEKYATPATDLSNSVNDELKVYEAYKKIEAGKLADLEETAKLIDSVKTEADALKTKTTKLATTLAAVVAKNDAAFEAAKVPTVKEVSAINSTQAVVTFKGEIGEAAASNFSVDNGLTVVKAEINADNKKQVTLTFNSALTDKETYKVAVKGVKSASGSELKEEAISEFTYVVGDVNKIELTKSTFINGDDIADFVKLTNDKGTDVTDKYTVEISSTSGKVSTTAGTVASVTANEVAYVQVTVKDGSGSVVKTSEAIKVNLSTANVSKVVGFALGADQDTVANYKSAVKAGTLTSEIKKSATPTLNVLVDNNGAEQLLNDTDVTKIENLTPSIATVSKSGGELVVNAYATGTAQVKLTIGDFVTTVSFTVKADSKVTGSTLSQSSVFFNTADTSAGSPVLSTETVNVDIVDQYNEAITGTVTPGSPATSGTLAVGGTNYTLSVKSSNTNVATATVDAASATSTLPVTITEVGKGTATITVELKDANGAVVFTKTLTVTGKDAGAFAGYVIDTDATAIDLDKDVLPEANDDVVNFTVYEVDAQGNKIKSVSATLEIQGYDQNPTVKNYIDVASQTVAVKNANATEYKSFSGSGTLNVDVKVNGTKIGTKSISYSNTDAVAKTAEVNTVNVVIDNDKIDGTSNQALTLGDLFYGHFDAVAGKYTVAPKLTVKDQSGKEIDWDTSASAGTLANTDTVAGISFTTTNVSDVVVSGSTLADTVTLASGKTTGSFTVVVSDVDTTAATDVLKAPVAFNVTIVD